MNTEPVTLKRSLSLPLITLYGIGTILGAGIYVLIGKVAAFSGVYTPIAFLVAAASAVFTGLSYAELSSRFPKSAGEAVYVENGLPWPWLSPFVGLLVIGCGIFSAAAIANGFVGYLAVFWQAPDSLVVIGLVLALGILAALGILESVGTATIITLVEVGGLIFVLWAASGNYENIIAQNSLLQGEPWPAIDWAGVFMGSFLAFYAYIGFEDMVNVAEEVVEPKKNLPLAIVLAIFVSSFLYILVAVVAVFSMELPLLAQSEAPLADIIKQQGFSPYSISLISLLAVINGALIQIIMSSRVLYGISGKLKGFKSFGKIHPKTRTPIRATALVTVIIIILALGFQIVRLAEITSAITLVVFAFVNLSLIRIKQKTPEPLKGVRSYPMIIPVVGLILCIGMLLTKFFL